MLFFGEGQQLGAVFEVHRFEQQAGLFGGKIGPEAGGGKPFFQRFLFADGGRAFGRAVAGHDAHLQDLRVGGQHLPDGGRDGVVGFHHRVGHVALALAEQLGGGDVHFHLRNAGGDEGQHAAHVLLLHHQRVVLAGEQHVHAVDGGDLRRAAADGFAADFGDGAGGVLHADVHRVGVGRLGFVVGGEGEGQPRLLRQLERVAHPQVVGGQPQKPRHQGAVGAVAVVGVGEAAVQLEHRLHRLGAQKAAGHERDAQGTGRVRAGRAHHEGADNVADSVSGHGELL